MKLGKVRTKQRKMMLIYVCIIYIMMLGVFGKLVYIMVVKGEYYSQKALDVQERERRIKAARGKILDRNNNVIASNKTVCTVSVIHRQIRDTDAVIKMLCEELDLEEKEVRKKVEKVSVREKIKSNVDKEIGDKIRSYDFDGVKVDEDYKRYYPYSSMASKVLGFTGADNQGIVGLEVKYDKYLQGKDGLILTPTDSRGIELDTALEERVEPVPGYNLVTGIDINIQKYCEQIAYNALGAKQANYVSVIVMNPKNGEIMAMVNAPEFDLNNPYSLTEEFSNDTSGKSKQDLLNNMWRNQCINDTYEPGSTFKIVTATAALSENLVSLDSTFNCPGFVVVDDRRIRCHKTTGHGSQDFVHGTMNSCNPVFVNVGLRVGVKKFYNYMDKLGLLKTTGISYGQLYRWKREGLIPEEWFVKRPSPTGQETFFPKEQILKRVQAIQTLKDRYSLEELAKLLSPEITNRVFTEEELECFTEIDIRVAADFMDVLNKDTFTFIEVLVMITLCRWKEQNLIQEHELYDLIPNVATTAANITEIKTFFLLLAVNEAHYGLFLLNPSPEGSLLFDERIKVVCQISLQELCHEIKLKYKDTFSFTFDEEAVKNS